MELNPEIFEILREFKINKDEGVLCLLGFFYGLDVETTCSEEVVKQINLTKIVEKDYKTEKVVWNIPLFKVQQTQFDWVKDWIEPFGKINPERAGSSRDAVTRMQDFFRKYPEYRKEDVYKARDLYLSTVKSPTYLMKSHKFIFDGAGAMKKSTLLEYCEKVKTSSAPTNLKGTLMT
jgi:hypothetical protein